MSLNYHHLLSAVCLSGFCGIINIGKTHGHMWVLWPREDKILFALGFQKKKRALVKNINEGRGDREEYKYSDSNHPMSVDLLVSKEPILLKAEHTPAPLISGFFWTHLFSHNAVFTHFNSTWPPNWHFLTINPSAFSNVAIACCCIVYLLHFSINSWIMPKIWFNRFVKSRCLSRANKI